MVWVIAIFFKLVTAFCYSCLSKGFKFSVGCFLKFSCMAWYKYQNFSGVIIRSGSPVE